MTWIARVRCPLSVCLGNHRLVWDDVTPPGPSQVYAYHCPYKGRVAIVDVRDAKWFRQGTPEARELMGSAAQLVEWRQRWDAPEPDALPY